MKRLLTIGEVAARTGVTVSTVRRWEATGRIKPELRTLGGHRRYSPEQIANILQDRKSQ